MRSARFALALAAIATLLAQPAQATFHLMQIEQVIGGVNGSAHFQAIQLRMRSLGQVFVSEARLVARDATGSNPVVLIAFPTDVANGSAGSRILVATSGFSSATHPALTPDFILSNPIPASYLAAGTLTYEDNFGTILWRLSWGSGYSGPGTGSLTNDADGQFSPRFAGPLPSTMLQALRYKFAASALSTNNANDYALTAGTAVFRDNAGDSGAIQTPVGVGDAGAGGSPALGRPAPNPVRNSMTCSITLPREAHVHLRLLDLQGRTVRTLADQVMPAGEHPLAWNATSHEAASLPAGLYFLGLEADGVRRTQKLVLIR